jgi:dipeptidyl aminopeptidase/acylaminoacyl peptidase
MTRFALALSFALVLCAAEPASAADARVVTIDDFDRVQDVGRPVLSPDGRHVAYAVEGRIFVVPAAGGDPRPVTAPGANASSPYWSRDGEALYFLSDRSGSRQVWQLPLTTFGEAEQVTDIDADVPAINFSRDERYLLLGFDDEGRPGREKPEKKDEQEPPDPFVIDRLQFKEDAGEGYLITRPSDHLYVYELATKELVQVTRGEYAEDEAEFSPDGRKIVFVSNREDDPDVSYRTDLWVVDADGKGEPVRLTDSDEPKSSPKWSPDGRWIAYRSAVDGVYGIERLTLISATGGEPRILTEELDRWVRGFRFSDDGRWIWFIYDNHGGGHLARVRVADGRIERVLEGDLVVSAFDVDRSGNVVVRANGTNDAGELYRVNRGNLARLTRVNDEYLGSLALGEKTKASFASADGTIVEAFITTPPDYVEGRRYPAILDIHGGPVGQFEWGYDFSAQFLAAHGYVVVQPNPRGSTGRGQAFVNAIYKTWGITDYDDVIAAIDYAVEAGLADPERLAVTGYSYGGYMTNVVITRTDRFKAAASGAGHAFIAANYGHDIYQRWYNWELGPPWENREAYDKLSPLLNAGKVVTPTIFIGGRLDWNVPILNSELFYQSLKVRGVPTRLVVYPGMHHGGWHPRYSKDYLQRIVAWFDEHVRGRAPAAP